MSIVLTTTITINASQDEVFYVLTDFASYGQWSNFSRIDGKAEEGTTLKMRMPGFWFTSTVTAVKPPTQLQWSAKIFSERLFLGQHTFTLTENADGTTLLTNTETFSGVLVAPFKGLFASNNKSNGYDKFNRALKTRVETLKAPPAPQPV